MRDRKTQIHGRLPLTTQIRGQTGAGNINLTYNPW